MKPLTDTITIAALLSILMSAAPSIGCSTTDASASDELLHVEIVCPRNIDGSVDCDPAAREVVLSTFTQSDKLIPGAEIRVVVAGENGDNWRSLAVCRVPESWAGSALAAKAEFIQGCRQVLTRDIDGDVEEEARMPASATFLGPVTHTYVINGSRPEKLPDTVEPQPATHLGVVCDVASGCSEQDVIRTFERWLSEVELQAGSSFRLYLPTADGSPGDAWLFAIPEQSIGTRLAAQSGAQFALTKLTLSPSGGELSGAIRHLQEELLKLPSESTSMQVLTKRQFHAEAVCINGVNSDGECPNESRRRVLQQWAYTALHAPGSTFTLWAAGETRSSYRQFFRLHVPSEWGPGGSEAYLRKALSSLCNNGGEFFGERASAIPPGASDAVLENQLFLLSRSGQIEESNGERSATEVHYSVVCDLSNSTLGFCSEERLVALYDAFLATSPGAGSTFVVWSPNTSRDSTEKIWSLDVPDLPSARLVAHLAGVGRELHGLLPETLERGSAIAEAISVAVEELQLRNGERQLILLSDMRQYTKGKFNFERKIASPARFLKWLNRSKLLVDAEGITLQVAGLHHKRGPNAPDFSAKDAKELLDVWEATFAAMKFTWNRTSVLCSPGSNEDGRKEVCHVQ